MAVERQLTILGEALNALRKLEPDILQGLPDADYAIRMRHVLVHGYAEINADQVWSIAPTTCRGCARRSWDWCCRTRAPTSLPQARRRRDLAKVSKATASTMIRPMMICWT
ncbi:HepT-like ribonuclease domain-containing protein [Geminicoccus flavidas]|uniref:HepT-like ribonuclease domain-containing protein n=1 Tax=Geminicoccus flavidas TaxID=2506407 RepID=UPI00135797F3